MLARDLSDVLAELARSVDRELATSDHAPAKESAYAHDREDCIAFCERHGLRRCPPRPKVLAIHLKALETRRSRPPAGLRADVTGLAWPTLRRRLAAIASRRGEAGLESPTDHPLVRKLLRRYSRTRGTARKKGAAAHRAAAGDPHGYASGLLAWRDQALLLLEYAGVRLTDLLCVDRPEITASPSLKRIRRVMPCVRPR